MSVCSACHGPQGEGAVGPALRNTRLDKAALAEVIKKGRTARPVSMPAWSQENGGPLKKHQVEDVVNFIENWNPEYIKEAQLKHRTATEPSTEKPSTESSPAAQTISQGKELYVNLGCAACHGPEGKGVIGPNIVGQTKDAIVSQVRKPRSPAMPAFSSERLSDSDLEKIVIFIGSLNK